MLREDENSNSNAIENEIDQEKTTSQSLGYWLRDEAPWWACSFTVHFVGFMLMALFAGSIVAERTNDLVAFGETDQVMEPPVDPPTDSTPLVIDAEIDKQPPFEINKLPSPFDFVNDKLTTMPGGDPDDSSSHMVGDKTIAVGKRDGVDTEGLDPTKYGKKSLGMFDHIGDPTASSKNGGLILGSRSGRIGSPSRRNDECIAAALVWLARHQMPDGSWSLDGYTSRCTDKSCTGQGSVKADAAATALGVLPFLAVGQTHRTKGKYQKTVSNAIAWLVGNQRNTGDLRNGSNMYAHGLATIALCETFAMSGDKAVGYAAQGTVDFLEAAQNPTTGGWRYNPGDAGDLSVMGWEVMALKSAQMAGLKVNPIVLERASKYLHSVAVGSHDAATQGTSASETGQFTYQPGNGPSNAMTAAGLLCTQYLGAQRNDPAVRGGTSVIMQHLPENADRDLYYWYYASQVMHNQPGPDWDIWNRKMRRLLAETQCREGCAAGSWDPQHPAPDRWAGQGGRVMTTCLSTLTLEVYFRYLPLYKFEPDGK